VALSLNPAGSKVIDWLNVKPSGTQQYVDFGTPVVGGPFTLAMLVLLNAPVLGIDYNVQASLLFFFDGSLGNPVDVNTWPDGFGLSISNVTSTVVVANILGGGAAFNFPDPRDFQPATWHHVVLVYDGQFTWRLYRNGVLHVGGTKTTVMPRRALRSHVYLGRSASLDSDQVFSGQVADFQYYDGIVFTASNVTDLYTGALQAGC
jgi:hypothetical protein